MLFSLLLQRCCPVVVVASLFYRGLLVVDLLRYFPAFPQRCCHCMEEKKRKDDAAEKKRSLRQHFFSSNALSSLFDSAVFYST